MLAHNENFIMTFKKSWLTFAHLKKRKAFIRLFDLVFNWRFLSKMVKMNIVELGDISLRRIEEH